MSQETSESGAPIYRYKPREESLVPPDMQDSNLEEISAHIEEHVGKVATVFHEIISDVVHVDIHPVQPTSERPYWTLITSGMSDLPMSAPPGAEEFAYAELMLCLPKTWKMDQKEWDDEAHYWPIRWLKLCARFPHLYHTWLFWGHTIPNGDPPEPFASGTAMCGMLLGTPRTVPDDFTRLPIRDDKVIHFLALYPIYQGEMELKLKEGTERLDELFETHKVTELLNPRRKEVTPKPRWKFW
jgi:hypothetical protein